MINWKKNTAIFLAGQSISIFGSSLVQFAITAYITVQTKSGIYATIAILCAILPTFLLSPFAGVWADRYDRKKLIIIADGSIAICTLIVAVAFLMGYEKLWMLFVALVFRALGSAVQMPCVSALLPDIVPVENLNRVNGINGSLNSLFALASPVMGAALLPIAPLGAIFFIDIVTAAIAIVIMLVAFKLPEKKADEKASDDYFKELKLGVRYILDTKYLKQFFIYCMFFCFMMAPAAFLTQVQVVRNYGDDYWRLSAIEVAFSAGMLVGGILITVWGGFKNRVHTIVLSTIVMGICTFLLGIKVPFVPYVAYMALFGVGMSILNTPAMTMLQERVEPQYMGRVFSVMTMITTSMMPLGMVLFGPLADFIDIEWLLLATGVVILVLTVMMSRTPALLKAGVRIKPKTE